jgi:chromosome partitioning protein
VHVIAIVSTKGGVGKTTVAASLAGALATNGMAVLAVDVDPQGGLSAALGAHTLKPGLYDVLLRGQPIEEAIQRTATATLDMLPAEPDLAGADVELRERPRWRSSLREALAVLAARYSVVVLDTPPGQRVLTYAAISASGGVIIASPYEMLSYRSLPDVFDMASRLDVPVLGIVPTFVHQRPWLEDREVAEALAEEYPDLVLPPIPRRAELRDAVREGKPIATHRPHGVGAAAFAALAKEVLHRAQDIDQSRGVAH